MCVAPDVANDLFIGARAGLGIFGGGKRGRRVYKHDASRSLASLRVVRAFLGYF